MYNYNEKQILKCKYCNKEYYSLNALKQHEIRCVKNINRIPIVGHKFTKAERATFKSSNKGKILIHKNDIQKFIEKNELINYIEKGWIKGSSDKIKQMYSKIHTGKANTYENEELRKQRISNTMKHNDKCGGKRHGSGRGHKGWYKGYFCDSTWELAFLIYCLDNNINIVRNTVKYKYTINNEQHYYLPDFIINNKDVIEIKGYKDEKAKIKEKCFPDIIIIDKYKIKKYLDYIKYKYGKIQIETLYDKK